MVAGVHRRRRRTGEDDGFMAVRKVSTEVAGSVWEVVVGVGDAVAAEDTLIVIESMKMELPVAAPWAGTVRAIHVEKGDLVEEGQVVVDLEA
jgi:acetyl-CoA carboxylase biotin carboxyl carrier protein